ncbi:unnamed protein product [Linum tenue]|uniref:DUF7781 domain-containing protein n=1 Tax=Linum tenue TaxID=586396 RepID=A0AAV0HRA2_9ROSI|nr:unnamed protein product [Linum tenue]
MMEPGLPSQDEPASWDELCDINLVPSELFFKFRKEIEGIRIGVNLEFYNAPINDVQTMLVLKPLSAERQWKFICKPIRQEIRIQSKKIPLTKFLNIQVGIGHNFKTNALAWQWKLNTCLGGDGISRIRNKTTLGLFPGLDFRALGKDESLFNMKTGRLDASLDRIETIVNPDLMIVHSQESPEL